MSVTLQKDQTSVDLSGPVPGCVSRIRKRQVLGRSAGGTVYAYDKGVDTWEAVLAFESVTDSEKAALVSFFDDTVDGTRETFTFTDETDSEFTARFLEPGLELLKVAHNVWDVRFTLELAAAD